MTEQYPDDTLVSADWVAERLDEFRSDDPSHRLVEVNNPTVTDESEYTPYEEGHVPGAVFFHWEEDLSDTTTRDIATREKFERVNGDAGISDDSTIVIYGGGRVPNWFALFAYWEYKYYGHDDIRVLDGGKNYWVANDYELSTDVPDYPARTYTASEGDDAIRAYRDEVQEAIDRGVPLVDVRSPEEFTGEVIAPEGLMETAQRGGHIPGARSVPTTTVLAADGRFLPPAELREIYAEEGITEDSEVVTYCRVGERSSIAWFVLTELLGFEDVENYDGSWTEWGNTIRAPVATGPAEE
jgi:thiosulfate/3-mercaptopyruvate sulfurtransferase